MTEEAEKTKNIFPLHVLKVSENTEVMVEVKSGETYYGVMKGVDKHMNIKLAEAYLTDKAGEHFHEISEVYIRGNTIKYFRMDPSTLQKIENTNYRCPQRWKEAQKRKSK